MKCNDRLGRLIRLEIAYSVMNSCPVFLLICTKFSVKKLTKQIWGISERYIDE